MFNGYNGADAQLSAFGGAAALREALEVMKSMDAGTPLPNWTGGGNFSPYMTQDLDMTLKVATFEEKEIKLIRKMPRIPYEGNSTVHEFRVLDSYGPRMSLFTGEGQNGPTVDGTAVYGTVKCKYMAHVRPVTEVARAIKNPIQFEGASNAEALTDTLAAKYDLGFREYFSFYGDERYEPGSIQGLKQAAEEAHATSGRHVVDMRGAYVDTDKLFDQVSYLCDAPNFGAPDAIYCPLAVKTDIGKMGGSHVRFNRQTLNDALKGYYGVEVIGIDGPKGTVPFEESTFLSPIERKLQATTALGTAADRPSNPTISVAIHVGAGGSAPLFTDTLTYAYKIVAVNAGGQAAPFSTSLSIAAQVGKSIGFTVDVPSGNVPTCYKVYRTEGGGSDYYEILTVPQTFDTDGVTPLATAVLDLNEWLPNTGVAFIVQHTPDVMGWLQLLPYMKYPLAHLTPQRNNLYMTFGMNRFPIKKRISMIKNIKLGLTTA